MNDDTLEKILTRILVEASRPGPEHERLKDDLRNWAVTQGYEHEYINFTSGANPDVLHGRATPKYLFCGDAKDSSYETVDNAETIKRIRGYFDDYAAVLGDNGFQGGYLAIATNSECEAQRWVPELNTLAKASGISGVGGTSPAFKIARYGLKQTWFVYW
jgi:hypothetical protein